MIVADENIDQRIIYFIRSLDVDVLSIREKSPGISDNEVIQLAISLKALLITEDKDFGELVFSHNIQECSVILLRYQSQPDNILNSQIQKALHHFKYHSGHTFYTVTPKKVRYRSL